MSEKIINLEKKLKNYNLEKYLSYNTLPILFFEYACYGEVNNKFLKEQKIEKFPTKVFTMEKTLIGWQEIPNWITIQDKELILKIITARMK